MRPIKRFWQQVSVAPSAESFAIHLDGKPLKTPAGTTMLVPVQPLAQAVAAEWAAVDQVIKPAAMPLTQLLATAIDIVPGQRGSIIDQLLAYVDTELLCYRAAEPEPLVQRQRQIWQPLLDWVARRYGAVFITTSGIRPIKQQPSTIKALQQRIEKLDDLHLAMLQIASTASGSLILGLALIEGHGDADDIFAAAELDATFQIEQWGLDHEAELRRTALLAELTAIEKMSAHLRQS
jgi:chaperone required for assembly of F1-ATPase